MDKPKGFNLRNREYTEEELWDKSIIELKDILGYYGLVKSGYKKKLIERILVYQQNKIKSKIKKTIAKKEDINEKLVKNIEEYNYYMEYFLNKLNADDYNYGIDLKEQLNFYKKVDEDKSVTKAKLNAWIETQLFNIRRKYEDTKRQENGVMDIIDSYPNPKYYNIILTPRQLLTLTDEMENGISTIDMQDMLSKFSGKLYKFNDGDIIGIDNSDIRKLPYMIIGIFKHTPYGYRAQINYNYEQDLFNGFGHYILPGFFGDADKEEIEAIYQFPFVKKKKERL
jgi:hypothetical protein